MDEVDLDELILERDNSTQTQRQQYAERHGLSKTVKIAASGVVAANTIAIRQINGAIRDVYNNNYSYMAREVKRNTGAILRESGESTVSRYTQRYYDRAKGSKHVSDEIEKTIREGIKRGESVPKLAKRVQNISNQNKNSAIRTARTEATRQMNTARMDAFDNARSLGIEIDKVWVSTHDSRTRRFPRDNADHVIMDGEIADFDSQFSNGLLFPGDPEGPPEEIINCRCTVTPNFKQ